MRSVTLLYAFAASCGDIGSSPPKMIFNGPWERLGRRSVEGFALPLDAGPVRLQPQRQAGIVPESRRIKKKAEKAVGLGKDDGRIPVPRRRARSAGH
jgi:hypothetical protein